MKRRIRGGGATIGALIALAGATATRAQTEPPAEPETPIAVTVNGEKIDFFAQGPIRSPDGTILVPLRGIFEKLGAGVQFVPTTKTVVAVRGGTTVVLRLGEARGFVNGKEYPLAVPAQSIAGFTLVPLRFLSEAFGAEVKWDAEKRLVAIASTKTPTTPVEAPDPTPSTRRIEGTPLVGTLVSLSTDDRQLVLKLPSGVEEAVALTGETVVLVKMGEGAATKQELSDLKPGDAVRIQRNPDGAARTIEARYDERIAVVKTVEPLATGKGFSLVFTDGAPIEVLSDMPVTREDGTVTPDQLRLGDRVRIRVNPETRSALAIAVVGSEPVAPARAEIAKVTHDRAGKWARAGDAIQFTVIGVPGAKGTLKVPGLTGAEGLPLVETATVGTYTAFFPVPAGVFLKEGTALASLTLGASTSPTVASEETFSIDAIAPVVLTFAPGNEARIAELRPQFTGAYADGGSGIDAKRCRLTLNGQEVSADAVFTDTFFSYKPPKDLKSGKVAMALVVRDVAGNELRAEWSFTILPIELISKIAVLPADRPLDFGDIVTVQVDGIPGAAASFSLGAAIKEVAMKENAVGVYVGAYTIKSGDVLRDGNVMIKFTPPGGKTIHRAASQTLTITAGAPDAPVIDLPSEGASVGNSVVLSGRTLPNATVRIAVRYQGRRVVVPTSGQVALLEVKADMKGQWVTPPITLKTPRDLAALSFTAEVIAIGTAGALSSPALVKFRR